MKILYLTNGFPPHRRAGTEIHTAAIAREFQRRGAEVRVTCAGDWETGARHYNGHQASLDLGIPVCRLRLNWKRAPDPFTYLYDNPVVGHVVADQIDAFEPDVVHVTSCETLSASVLRVAKAKGIRLVLSVTDFWFLCPRMTLLRSDGDNCSEQAPAWECTKCLAGHSKIYRWSMLLSEAGARRILSAAARYPFLTRRRGLRGMIGDMSRRQAFLKRALQWPDARITASQFVRRTHEVSGLTSPLAVRPYGHDLSWIGSIPQDRSSPQLRVAYIGQILPAKGVHLLIEAARRLQADLGDRFVVDVYGSLDQNPDYGSRLTALSSGLPNVRFRGTYCYDRTSEVLSLIDVLVVPSLWYDFPLVIHESFATKTPVIATNLGGMAESVCDGRNGFLFPRGSVDELEARLRRLILDPGLLERLRAGVAPVKTIAAEADELEGFYNGQVA